MVIHTKAHYSVTTVKLIGKERESEREECNSGPADRSLEFKSLIFC